MSEEIEFSAEAAGEIYRRITSGESSRSVAAWYGSCPNFKKVSHTRILKLMRDMRAEEAEIGRALASPDAEKPPASDQEQLAEALRELRQLRIHASFRRSGNTESMKVALRALALEISTLRFKMTQQKRIEKEERPEPVVAEPPVELPAPIELPAPVELPAPEPAPLEASQQPNEPVYPPGTVVINRTFGASSNLSKDFYNSIPVPGMRDGMDSSAPLGLKEVFERLRMQGEIQQSVRKQQARRKRSGAGH